MLSLCFGLALQWIFEYVFTPAGLSAAFSIPFLMMTSLYVIDYLTDTETAEHAIAYIVLSMPLIWWVIYALLKKLGVKGEGGL